MMNTKQLLVTWCCCLLVSTTVEAQEVTQSIHLEGPRVGFTYLPPKVGEWLKYVQNEDMSESAVENGLLISQFGWQFEERFVNFSGGGSLLVESILLVGGLEKGLFLPTASFVVGHRSSNGFEFGMGPNFSTGGPGIVYAIGMTRKVEQAFIPINLAMAQSKNTYRISVLIGFNTRKR